MSRIKNYIFELAETLGKEFEEVTPEDMQMDFERKAVRIMEDPNSSKEDIEKYKQFLPKN